MLQNYSFVFLSEIKTSAKISCTGFTVFQHSAKQGHRGGVALLIKPVLRPRSFRTLAKPVEERRKQESNRDGRSQQQSWYAHRFVHREGKMYLRRSRGRNS